MRPDYLSLTQSQYGWSAFTDGYYFNVARSLPITSGHGGYDDYGPGFFNPSFTLEMARARDLHQAQLVSARAGTATRRRTVSYGDSICSFQTNVQGMISPPDSTPFARLEPPAEGVVESNQLMKRLGTIFTTMPVTKPPVAMLYSLSQAIHVTDRRHAGQLRPRHPQGQNLPLTYLAGKVLQQPFLPVLDEDVIDGTLANDHQGDGADFGRLPRSEGDRRSGAFAACGGLVLLTADSSVKSAAAQSTWA